jgi:hypothetical protein
MGEVRKVLGQSAPGATTLTPVYTVPPAGEAVISTVTVANQSATPTAYRISIAVAGLADTAKQYIAYDVAIGANSVHTYTIGMTLGPGDIIRVYNTLATLSFNVFGVEIT